MGFLGPLVLLTLCTHRSFRLGLHLQRKAHGQDDYDTLRVGKASRLGPVDHKRVNYIIVTGMTDCLANKACCQAECASYERKAQALWQGIPGSKRRILDRAWIDLAQDFAITAVSVHDVVSDALVSVYFDSVG